MSFYSKKHLTLVIIFFLTVSGLIIFSWFRFGFIYGGGDVGLPTYNPARVFEVTRYIWWESAAPGYPLPHGLTSAPLSYGLSLLQQIGFTPLYLQASFFFLLFFLMGFGMYLLSGAIFGTKKPYLLIIVSLFYLFNPYMMIQVWHRFVHTSIVFAALLPFFALFWMSWLRSKNPRFLLVFMLTSFLGTYLFGTIAYVLTFWLFIALLTILESIIPWVSVKHLSRNIFFLFIGFTIWILINSWWLVPTFSVGPELFSEQHSNEESIITLLEISRQEIVPFIAMMINPFYLYEHNELGAIYNTFIFRLIPWIFTLIIFIGFIKSLYDKNLIKIGIGYLVILLLSKGAASPFGYLFLLGFDKFFFLGAFRNPFEKIGILLPFFAAILFAVGLKSFGKIVYLITIPIIVLVFAWPMFFGTIFGNSQRQPFVKVPYSYQQADEWLNSQTKEGKILHLPLTLGESISYNWEYGYSGVEPSNLFFTSHPSISRGLNVKSVDEVLKMLVGSLKNVDQHEAGLIDLLGRFNIRFIVLHEDVIWKGQGLEDPVKVKESLDKLSFLDKKVRYGDISIYEISQKFYQPKFILKENIAVVLPEQEAYKESSQSATISLKKNNHLDRDIEPYTTEMIIFPENRFISPGNSEEADLHAINVLTLTDGSPLAEFVYAKNYLDYVKGNRSYVSVGEEMIRSSQILVKIYQAISTNSGQDLSSLVGEYNKSISEIFVNKFDEFRLYSYLKDPKQIFISHAILLVKIEPYLDKSKPSINQSLGLISKFLSDKKELPLFSSKDFKQKIDNLSVHQFYIPKQDKYELYVDASDNFKEGQRDFLVNGQIKSLQGRKVDKYINFGQIDLDEGDLEISYDGISIDNVFLKKVNSGILEDKIINLDGVKQSSPVSYKGSFRIEKPTFFIFKESFHSGWKLTLFEKGVSTKVVNHYIANGYGNGWFISKGGDYEFRLEFEPQNKVMIGIWFSAVGWVAILLWVVKVKLVNKL